MYLTRHQFEDGACWAVDGHLVPPAVTLESLLRLPGPAMAAALRSYPSQERAPGPLLPPVEGVHEVWAAGVTYVRSREAREAESSVKDVYTRVYEAARPELFFKATGRRVVGHGAPIRVRADSHWNVPEPELTLVVNAHREIVGYCAGNDVSSRDIEGENPLYLPQAKVYDGACALGPGLVLCDVEAVRDLPVRVDVVRDGQCAFDGATTTAQIKRPLEELVAYLCRELSCPAGVFLMTGTGIVPPPEFSLVQGDRVRIRIGSLTLENTVDAGVQASQR